MSEIDGLSNIDLCEMALKLAQERTNGSQPALYLLVERMRPVLVAMVQAWQSHGKQLVELMLRQDKIEESLELAKAEATMEITALRAERDALVVRRDELLATVAKLSQTLPFPEEIENWESQRGKLVAEIGTLRADRDEWRRRAQAHGCDVERGDIDCG